MRQRHGFTLIELMVVIAILAILIITGMTSWRNHINKARDAQRKADLQRISIAFEDYYNDHNCYPPEDILNNCGGAELTPYLFKIPCDPITKQPYHYEPDTDHPACFRNFRILTLLNNLSDPVAADLGYGPNYNYGVASTNISLANPVSASPSPSPTVSPSPSPSPLPSPPSGNFACDNQGICNIYENPSQHGCPITFDNSATCQNYCDQSSIYWCQS